MQFGKLRHTIELQNFNETKDSHGHVERGYVTYATVKADARGQYGMESAYAERIESRAIFRFVIRHRRDIRPQHRLIWKDTCYGDRTFEIQYAIDMRGDRRMTTILAIEIQNNNDNV